MDREPLGSGIRVAYVTSIHPDFNARVWKMATAAAKSGAIVHLVCPWNVPNGTNREGVTIHSFPRIESRPWRPILIPLHLGRRLIPLLRNVDLVHFHDIDILPWMALLSMFKSTIYDVHENYADEMLVRDWIPRIARTPLYHVTLHVERALAKVIRNVVLAVPAQEQQFGDSRIRSYPLRNYATLQLLNRVRDDYLSRDDTVVFSGGNYESNGSMLLLDIAARVKRLRPSVKFLMVDLFASDAFRRRFMTERARLDLEDTVRLDNPVPSQEVMSLLNRATIAVAMNLRVVKQEKAIPTKLFEYMAAGLPIVSSDLPFQTALLSRHEMGLLSKPEDPDSFVSAIVRLVDNRRAAQRMGEVGRQAFVQWYSWESQLPGLISFYKSILAVANARS